MVAANAGSHFDGSAGDSLPRVEEPLDVVDDARGGVAEQRRRPTCADRRRVVEAVDLRLRQDRR